MQQLETLPTKEATTVNIPIQFVDIVDAAWRQWREIEYLKKAKMRNRIEDFSHDVFTDTKLCIDLDTREGSIFSEGHNERLEFFMNKEDWSVSRKIVQTYIDGNEYVEPFEKVSTSESYYKDFIHNFKVFANSKHQAHAAICKECANRGLRFPKLWQIKKVIS